MSLEEFLTAVDQITNDFDQRVSSVDNQDDLEAVRIEFVGAKNGRIKAIQKLLGAVPKDGKPEAGKKFKKLRDYLQQRLDSASDSFDVGGGPQLFIDPTLPGILPRIGSVHPVTQTIEHLKEIMGRLGFSVVEGPEVEDNWHNFVALNIPDDHPARDPLDNFYLSTAEKNVDFTNSEQARLLRSQTSTVQIRVMENSQPPTRIISIGRVYRPDEADATHFPMFHQMEGLYIDSDVTMAQLKSTLRLFATNYLGGDVNIRFRPSFFPFTEPSVEVDFWWNGSWIEFGGAGMVDPNVLTAVGYDPEKVSGFAFGLGIERLCMRRFSITDIRDLYRNDVRFLRQF